MKLKINLVESELKLIANYLTLARKRRNWSQQEMADRLQVTRLTIRRLEKDPGKVHLETFLRALHLLDLLEGFSEVANPVRDKKAVDFEVWSLKNKKAPRISDDEVNF